MTFENPPQFGQPIRKPTPVDPTSGVSTGIDYSHQRVHSGQSFHVDYNVDDGSPLLDNTSLDLWVSVPEGVFPHITWIFWCQGLAQSYIYENPTVSDEGTELTPFNRNRNASREPQVVVKHTPTITAEGTALHDGDWFGGKEKEVPGDPHAVEEIILAPGRTYLWRITSRGADQRAGIELDWYENP